MLWRLPLILKSVTWSKSCSSTIMLPAGCCMCCTKLQIEHSQAIDWFSQDFIVWKIPNQKWMNSQGFKAWMKTNIYCTQIHDMPFCQYIMLNLTFDNIFQYKQFFHVFIHQLFFHDFRKMRIFVPRRLIFRWLPNSTK